jgi:O-antigen/teichoic acid export membrane protein
MSKSRSFFGSAFFYTIGVILAQGTSVIATLVLGRLMPTGQFALVAVYYMWFTIFGVVAGLQAFGSVNNARLQFGRDKLDAYTSSTYGLGVVSMAVMLGLFFLFQNFLSVSMQFPFYVILLCLVQGFFSFTVQHIAAKYRVLNQPGKFVFWTAAVYLLRLGISVYLVLQMTQNQYLGDVYGSFIAFGAVGVAAAVFIFARGKTFFNAKWWKYCLSISLPLVASGLANYVLLQANRVMLQNLSTPLETGLYSYVATIAVAVTGVWLAFNNAWSVWYFDKTHAGAKEDILNLYKKYSLFVTFLSIAFTLVSPDIVRILGGRQYEAGVPMIPLIAAGCFFLFLYSFAVNYETYKRKTPFIAIGTVSAAALNILLNLYLIPRYGGMGAAFATLISYAALFVIHYIFAKFIIRGFEIGFVQLLIPALTMLAAMAATYLLMDVWPARWAIGVLMLVLSFRTYRQSRHIMME